MRRNRRSREALPASVTQRRQLLAEVDELEACLKTTGKRVDAAYQERQTYMDLATEATRKYHALRQRAESAERHVAELLAVARAAFAMWETEGASFALIAALSALSPDLLARIKEER